MSRFSLVALVILCAIPGLTFAQPPKVETPKSPLAKLVVYPANIELTVPTSYDAQGGFLVEIGAAVTATVP